MQNNIKIIHEPKHYITKSFFCIGKRLDYCLGCKYCRELDGETTGFDISTMPKDINPILSRIPVAVNLFYGDPLIQIPHTINLLKKLESSRHIGPVIIITKGNFRRFPNIDFNLDLHFAFSTFGMDSKMDGGSLDGFISNLEESKRRGRYKYSIEFRPIIYGINDSNLVIDYVMGLADKYKMAVGFSGLQGKPGVISKWGALEDKLRPYPGTSFGFKKYVPDAISEYIISSGIPTFKKTSCLISYTHNLDRDYNAHYYRPNEVGCARCIMYDKCIGFKRTMDEFIEQHPDTRFDLPFNHLIIHKTGHQCPWLHKGCSFPTEDCSNLSGHFIEINQPVTTSDVRAIKWLTGMTVSSEFVEDNHLSNIWLEE